MPDRYYDLKYDDAYQWGGLIDLVGRENFNQWVQKALGQDDRNIKEFVRHFQVEEKDFRQTQEQAEEPLFTSEEIDAIYGHGDMSVFLDEEPYVRDYDYKYYDLPGELIDLVDKDAFSEWTEKTGWKKEEMNIQKFVEYFQISEEDFRRAEDTIPEGYERYTSEEIDAIYGHGDMSAFMDENPYVEEEPCD